MRLADNETTIRIDGEVIRLRPTLRAACRLYARHGGYDAIMREIADGSVTMMADVIVESTGREWETTDFLNAFADNPASLVLEPLIEPLLRHVLMLAGVDADDTAHRAPAGKPMGFDEFHIRLFQIATGYLGWGPEAAWNATPAEITEAYKGRLQLLKDIFGGGDGSTGEDAPNTDRDEAGWLALKMMTANGANTGV